MCAEAARREQREWSKQKRGEGKESGDRAESTGKAELERGWTVRRLQRGGESSGGVESGDGGEDGDSAVRAKADWRERRERRVQ